jgi:hypothetical protein
MEISQHLGYDRIQQGSNGAPMTFIPIEVQISPEQVLSAVERMSEVDLESFIGQILQIRGKRQAPSLPAAEADLLQKITHCIPHKMQTRFNELVKQRQTDTIDQASLQELCDLSDQIELLEADRIQQLAQLAQLRSTSIEDLIKQLHLIPVNHG